VKTAVPPRAELAESVSRALDTVRDPELDEPITSLGFVASCVVADGLAEVRLRLPTYFCAPNFAYLMVADAHDAVSAVAGIAHAVVVLDDHFASDAINAGVAARAGFVRTFGDQAVGELDELRADFVRRAVLAGTDRVCRAMLSAGRAAQDLIGMTLRAVPPSRDLDRLRARRREIGLPADDDAALLVDPSTGDPIDAGGLRMHLGRARLSRVNIEANSSICRGMLAHRYGTDDARVQELS
jgi:metal-sulfur cluster biosynthetic enzyme